MSFMAYTEVGGGTRMVEIAAAGLDEAVSGAFLEKGSLLKKDELWQAMK